MAFHLGEEQQAGINEMNLIPLIDIMLVLMIIFLVTATVSKPSIPLSLPQTSAKIQPPPAQSINISINAQGQLAWDAQSITLPELAKRLAVAAQATQRPSILLRADKDARYDEVAGAMQLILKQIDA
jgi:biopolymer transport protein ExbD